MRLIDADALHEVITHLWYVADQMNFEKGVFQAIDTAPTIGQQAWVPCSERLPEDGVKVWVTIQGHDVIRCEKGESLEDAIERISKIRWVTTAYWSEDEHGWNDPYFGCPLVVGPIAWMPLPEPYKRREK